MEQIQGKKTNLWTSNFTLACLANFLMGFSFYLLMPTLPFYLAERFHTDNSTIGFVVSCYVIAALVIRPFSGYLVDSFSRKMVYMISYLLFVGFCLGYLVAGTILFLIVLRFLHGLTWGIITTAGNTLAIDIMPSDKRGQGIGFYGLAFNISMAIGPVAGIFLYQHYDFDILFYSAIATGFIGMVFAQFIKAPVKPKITHHQAISLDRFLMIKGIPIGINLLLITISYGMILSFAAMYSKEMHADNPGLFYVMLAIGIAVARAFSGKMIDRGELHKASLLGLTLLAVGLSIFALWQTPTVYYIIAFVVGIGYGVSYPAFQTIFINMANHNQRGTANSTYYTAFDAGVGIGMLSAGKIAAVASLSAAFGFSAVTCIIAIFFYMWISIGSYKKYNLTV